MAQLEAKGKKIAIIEPGAENPTSANQLLNERVSIEDTDPETNTPVNGD